MTIDWSRPIEAVGMDGRVASASVDCLASNARAFVTIAETDAQWCPWPNGHVPGGGWVIRNVPEQLAENAKNPTPTQYAPELVQRMVALISKMEIGASSILEEYHPDNTGLGKTYREAVSIGRCLRGESDEAVDVVEQMRRESWVVDDSFAAMCVEAASRGIARGRQLQRGEAA